MKKPLIPVTLEMCWVGIGGFLTFEVKYLFAIIKSHIETLTLFRISQKLSTLSNQLYYQKSPSYMPQAQTLY